LDSKSHKCLQELNLALNKQAMLLDNKQTILVAILQDYLAGATLEQVLRGFCTELTELEVQDVTLHQQIAHETQKLDQLEQKVQDYNVLNTYLTSRRSHRSALEVVPEGVLGMRIRQSQICKMTLLS